MNDQPPICFWVQALTKTSVTDDKTNVMIIENGSPGQGSAIRICLIVKSKITNVVPIIEEIKIPSEVAFLLKKYANTGSVSPPAIMLPVRYIAVKISGITIAIIHEITATPAADTFVIFSKDLSSISLL